MSGLCLAHYQQQRRGLALTSLRGPRGAHGDDLVRLTVQVPEDSREQLEQLARGRGVSLAQVARDVLALGLASLEEPASE